MRPHCPWCGARFMSWALAKPHVKYCDRAPRPRGKANAERMKVYVQNR